MPEYAIALIISAAFGSYAWLNRKITDVDERLDAFTVKVAEVYVTKEQLQNALNRLENQFNRIGDRLESSLLRMEDKLDAHVSEDRCRIENVINKYNLKNND
jgi:DNA repair exonuclease SbcCD ATPase subunit